MRSDNSVRVPIDVQFRENRVRNRGWYRNCGNVRPLREAQANSVAGAADPLLVVVSGLPVEQVEDVESELQIESPHEAEVLGVIEIQIGLRSRPATSRWLGVTIGVARRTSQSAVWENALELVWLS